MLCPSTFWALCGVGILCYHPLKVKDVDEIKPAAFVARVHLSARDQGAFGGCGSIYAYFVVSVGSQHAAFEHHHLTSGGRRN
jgi:hypothetical protein